MTTSERRRLRALADEFPAAREALLSLAGPRRSVKAAKKERIAAKKESRAERNERMAGIRRCVMERAAEKCELCQYESTFLGSFPAQEVHHLISGSGKRRQHESTDTCIAVCLHHHALLHKSDPDTLDRAFAWARDRGFGKAMFALETRIMRLVERRMTKVEASTMRTP